MGFLAELKAKRDKKKAFGIKPKKFNRVIIPTRLIEKEEKNLVQWCKCKNEPVAHSRITYDKGKKAVKCLSCVKITLIPSS